MLRFGLVIDVFCFCCVGINERAGRRTYRGMVAAGYLQLSLLSNYDKSELKFNRLLFMRLLY